MASSVARGVILGFVGLSIIGGTIAVWRTRRPVPPGVVDADFEKASPDLDASVLPAMTPDAEPAPDAAIDIDEQLASLKRRFGKALTVVRGGPGWATFKNPKLIGLVGRSGALAFCRETTPREDILTVDAPPNAETDGGLPRYRNPPDLANFALDRTKLASANVAAVCPAHPKEFLRLDFACHTRGCELMQLRDNDAGAPRSIVLSGALCHEQSAGRGDAGAKTPYACDHVSLVYDLVDDDWRAVDDPPERPEKIQDLDKDGRPEFPRTLAYLSSVDLQNPDTWHDPLIIDAHGFEAWDGARWTTAAPRIQRVYGKAYAASEKRATELQRYSTDDNVNCRPGDLEAIARSVVDSYMSRPFTPYNLPDGAAYVERSPDAETNRISGMLAFMMPRCMELASLEHTSFDTRYLPMFEVLREVSVPPYLPLE